MDNRPVFGSRRARCGRQSTRHGMVAAFVAPAVHRSAAADSGELRPSTFVSTGGLALKCHVLDTVAAAGSGLAPVSAQPCNHGSEEPHAAASEAPEHAFALVQPSYRLGQLRTGCAQPVDRKADQQHEPTE